MKKKSKNTLFQAIIAILFVLLVYQTKTLQNLLNVTINDYEARFSKVHDFCSVESVGYLKYIKKKYNLDKMPIIVNYVHTPNLKWVMINPKTINNYSDYKIFLNYPGKIFNLKFKTKNNNIYQVNKLNFYRDKINTINTIEIKFNEKFKSNNEPIVELYSNAITNQKNKIRTYKSFFLKKDDTIEFNINFDLVNFRNTSESLIFMIKNLRGNKIDKINFTALNKYDIEKFKVIDNYDNCYLVK